MRDAVDGILEQWRVERPDLDARPMGIFARLTRAQRVAAGRLEASFAEHDLNRDDFDALATLRRSGPPFRLTPTQLYRSALVSSGTMTGRIDRLEGLGLVDRRADPTDRRGSLVGLTPAGRRLADSLVERLLDDMAALVRELDEQERTDVAAALQVLLVALEGDSEDAGAVHGAAIGSGNKRGARSHSALQSHP
jgi:DNA-binding MarR family transcriptional regulator